MFEYCPVKIGLTEGKLELNSNDLGSFSYDLKLQALRPNVECELRFNVSLGTIQTHNAKFINYTKARADYTCNVSWSFYRYINTCMVIWPLLQALHIR